MTSAPRVPVSWGELIDKITILHIKSERLRDDAARANVARELAHLEPIAEVQRTAVVGLGGLERDLRAVNEALWTVEDDIRVKEREGAFDDTFIALARSVYRLNDRRAALKRQINELLKSELVEEKLYAAGG